MGRFEDKGKVELNLGMILKMEGHQSPTAYDFQTYRTALVGLAETLHALAATGPSGFEGLVADVLADLSGLEIRLAKSGSQRGRDGSSLPAEFAIAFEAKRYDRSLSLEDVAAKAWNAAHELGSDVDLWALCATCEVGDETARKLGKMLDLQGITLLVLDWTERPIPPLAAAIAAAPRATSNWFARHQSSVACALLAEQLEQIAAHPAFSDAVGRLSKQLHAAHVGLDSLRRTSSSWLLERLKSRELAQDTFGQFLAIADSRTIALNRKKSQRRVSEAVGGVASVTQPTVVALVGDEGDGKSWILAQWLIPLLEQLVPLWIGGPQLRHVVPDDAVETLSRLLAAQHTGTVERWRQQINRWRQLGSLSTPNVSAPLPRRFVVILDGLNESPDFRWDSAIKTLADLVAELGGALLLTSRRHFWREEIKPRLGSRIAVREIAIEGYDTDELKELLERHRIDVTSVSERVRAFIRNPRVCAVAVRLLDRLSLAPEDLTVDRLLLEYWHARLEERGGYLLHTSDAFHELLRRHARDWLAGERETFARDEIAGYSSVAKRRGPEALRQDVGEIEDGRFMTIDPSDPMRYTFRQEALPFAIGLLVQHQLREATTVSEGTRGSRPLHEAAPEVALNGLLDPVRGFDRLSDILSAAVGLACVDATYPDEGLQALILAWHGLQNQSSDERADEMSAYAALRPGPFFNLAESASERIYDGRGKRSLPRLLLTRRRAPRILQESNSRTKKWLGMWSRRSRQLPVNAQGELDHRRATECERRLSELLPSERARFAGLATEVQTLPNLDLVKLMSYFIGGYPLVPHWEALLGWAMVRAIAPDMTSSSEALSWTVRLNRADAEATRLMVHACAGELDEIASEPMRRAVATLLWLLGDGESAAWANALNPTTIVPGWRRVEQFCDTDPFDPSAGEPTNLHRAINYAEGLEHSNVWVAMTSTTHDGDIETVTPALARFAPSVLVQLLQRVARTAPERIGMPLRQLAWRLPELSPLLDDDCIGALESAFERLLADTARSPERDLHWILSNFARALAPHGVGESHIARVRKLPHGMPLFLDLREGMPYVSPAKWLEVLKVANAHLHGGDEEPLTRVLFLLAAPNQPLLDELVPEAQDIIYAALLVPHGFVAQCAAELVRVADNTSLDDRFLQLVVNKHCEERRGDFQFARALAEVVARRSRADLLALVDQDYLGAVIGLFGESDAQLTVDHIGRALNALVAQELPSIPEGDFEVVIPMNEKGMNRRWAIEDRDRRFAEDDDLVWNEESRDGQTVRILDVAASEERSAIRREEYQKAIESHRDLTRQLGVLPYDAPSILVANRAVATAPDDAARWLEQVDQIARGTRGWQIRNLGIALAGAYARRDSETAARVLRTLRDVGSIRITVENDGVELWNQALFSAESGAAISVLRYEVFDGAASDEALETLVSAADKCGASAWLDSYVQARLDSATVGDQARALAISGLRRESELADSELRKHWGDGFLGLAAKHAREWRARAAWTVDWIRRASQTKDPVDYWRFGTLAVGVADVRSLHLLAQLQDSWGVRRFGPSIPQALKRASIRRSKKRADTLFGHRVWDKDFVETMCAINAKPSSPVN